jgi:iron complex transport system permease protein
MTVRAEKINKVRERVTSKRVVATVIVMFALLVLVAIIAVSTGSERIDFQTIVKIVVAKLTGQSTDIAPEQMVIIAEIRLPRVVMAIVVGAALSVAGAAYQALLRNPLADPYVLGVSTGAAVGAIAATIFAESLSIGRPLAAFLGAVLTIATVILLGQGRRRAPTERLILAGIITNTFLSSVVIFLMTSASGLRLQSVFSWLIGDLGSNARLLPLVSVFILAGIAVIYFNSRSLNLMMTGEEEALALGVEVRRVKAMVYIASSLITGAAVSVSGVIGFVGLVIPHAVRLASSSDNRLVVPASALAGGIFLLIADTIARTIISPRELHVGVVTAFIGAPVFVYLLRRAS